MSNKNELLQNILETNRRPTDINGPIQTNVNDPIETSENFQVSGTNFKNVDGSSVAVGSQESVKETSLTTPCLLREIEMHFDINTPGDESDPDTHLFANLSVIEQSFDTTNAWSLFSEEILAPESKYYQENTGTMKISLSYDRGFPMYDNQSLRLAVDVLGSSVDELGLFSLRTIEDTL